MEIANLFAFRSTDPRGLATADDPVGPENDRHLKDLSALSGRVVVAWGTDPRSKLRMKSAAEVLTRPLWCLGMTKDGSPRHPLYVPYSRPLTPREPRQ
jgi:hypothetical protein